MFRCTLSFCRKFVCGVIGCCLVASAAGTAVADTKAAKGAAASKAETKAKMPSQEEVMAEMMKFANPGDNHKALEPLVGTWKSSSKMYMGPGEPQVSEGTCERSWIMGGRFLLAKHTGVMAGAPFEGMEIMGYDNRFAQYVTVWIDNMGTGIYTTTSGVMDPATKTLTMAMAMFDPMANQMMPYKLTTKIVDQDHHTFSISANRGGKEMTDMEISYTRVK